MSDASPSGEDWAGYLRRMTKRPDWSVAKLARESKIHRATIFGWMKGDGGVTVDSVRRIAEALGDDPENALRAAGAVNPAAPDQHDEEMALIMAAPVGQAVKDIMIERLRERREQERQQRLAYIQSMIDVAKHEG